MYLPLKYYGLAAVLALLVTFHYYDRYKAVTTVRTEYSQKIKTINTELEGVRKQAKNTEATLKSLHDKDTKEKNAKIETITVERDRLIVSLRDRPTRTIRVNSSTIGEAPQACTGRELFKEDGEFLTREAARADTILVERDYYYNEYEKARLALDALNGQKQAP